MPRVAASVAAQHRRLPDPVGSARSPQTERSGLVLTLRDAAGNVGCGEAAPLPGFSRDDFEGARTALEAIAHSGLDVSDDPDAHAELARAGSAVASAGPAARFAVETAVVDLLGARRGVPAWRLLRGHARMPEPRPVAALLRTDSEHALLESAEAATACGIRAVKVKLGFAPFDEELRRLERLRAQLGPNIPVRLDANATWSAREAARRLPALAAVAPEFIEDPVIFSELHRLDRSAVPVALDESLLELGPDDLDRMVDRISIAALVLKPMALGGFCRCFELARWATRHHADVLVSHLFDGPLAFAACAALALAIGSPARATGLAPHAGLAAWPRVELPMFTGGAIVALDRPGLGLERDIPWR